MDLSLCKGLIELECSYVIGGCDEVGRGPLAGPVVACSAMLHLPEGVNVNRLKKYMSNLKKLGITDSKNLTAVKRELLLQEMGISIENLSRDKVYSCFHENDYSFNISFALSEVSHEEIDVINIHHASLRAMKKAVSCVWQNFMTQNLLVLSDVKGRVIIDGTYCPDFKPHPKIDMEAVVKGDSKSIMVGLASIIAKEYRDYLMKQFDITYPGYGFAENAGYPTSFHRNAIVSNGISPIHRITYKGVREFSKK